MASSFDFGNALSSAASGAATGASVGSVVPGLGTGIGAGVGALIGLGGNLVRQQRQQSLLDSIQEEIKNLPDYRKSEGYVNAASQAGRADRWAQEGLSSEQKMLASQGINRLGSQALSNASDLETGLLGMSGVTESLRDSYSNLAMQDATIQRARQAQALAQQKNFQNAQDDAFSLDLGKAQSLLDLQLGNLKQSRQDSVTGQQNVMTGVQNLLNSGALDQKYEYKYAPQKTAVQNTNPNQQEVVGYEVPSYWNDPFMTNQNNNLLNIKI